MLPINAMGPAVGVGRVVKEVIGSTDASWRLRRLEPPGRSR